MSRAVGAGRGSSFKAIPGILRSRIASVQRSARHSRCPRLGLIELLRQRCPIGEHRAALHRHERES